MKKWRFYLDFAKEERWLESQLSQGWLLDGKGWRYRFRKVPATTKSIRIDYRTFRRDADYLDYLALFEDSGWVHLAGTKRSGVQYFQQAGEEAGELFSDDHSRAGRYHRWASLWGSMAVLGAGVLTGLGLGRSIPIRALVNPRLLYLTPGLWERQGDAFSRAFWLETPFALMRGVFLWAPAFLLVFSAVCLIRARKLAAKEMTEG